MPTKELVGSYLPIGSTNSALLWTEQVPSGRALSYVHRRDFSTRLVVRCPGTIHIAASVAHGRVWAADDLGRVWHVDLHSGALMGPWPVDGLRSV